MMTATAGRTPCGKRICILPSPQLLFLQNTKNLVISRCCFAEDGKEMHQDSKRTCTAIVLFIKPFVRCRSRQRRRRGFLNLPIVRWETGHASYVIGKKISAFTRPHVIGFVADIFFSTLKSGFIFFRIRCRIRRIRADGSRIRNEKVADSKISGYVWTGPKANTLNNGFIVHFVIIVIGNLVHGQYKIKFWCLCEWR